MVNVDGPIPKETKAGMLKYLPSFDGRPLLYFVVTPLGNLSDISPRVRETLLGVHAVYAEDTRNARKLLSHLRIEGKKVFSIRSQNESEEAKKAIDGLLKTGGSIAYMSDAGHPCLSDPGARLAKEAFEHEVGVSVVPATSAALAAYCQSGFQSPRFYFQGFLPLKGKERKRTILELANRSEATIVYESPLRIQKTLKDLSEVLEETREVALCREISKVHEESIHGCIRDFLDLREESIRGEMVLVIEGAASSLGKAPEIDLAIYMEEHAKEGTKAVKKAVSELGVSRKEAYQAYLSVKSGD